MFRVPSLPSSGVLTSCLRRRGVHIHLRQFVFAKKSADPFDGLGFGARGRWGAVSSRRDIVTSSHPSPRITKKPGERQSGVGLWATGPPDLRPSGPLVFCRNYIGAEPFRFVSPKLFGCSEWTRHWNGGCDGRTIWPRYVAAEAW